MSAPVATAPTFESIDAEFRRISGLLGEQYVVYDQARKRLNALKKERDALVSQFQLFRKMAEAQSPTQAANPQVTDDDGK